MEPTQTTVKAAAIERLTMAAGPPPPHPGDLVRLRIVGCIGTRKKHRPFDKRTSGDGQNLSWEGFRPNAEFASVGCFRSKAAFNEHSIAELIDSPVPFLDKERRLQVDWDRVVIWPRNGSSNTKPIEQPNNDQS